VSDAAEISVPLGTVGVRRRTRGRIAVMGAPNSGKSTLFNRLTGLRQKTANFPGVTVEKHEGAVVVDDQSILLVDLPGTYSLVPHSLDERIAVDVVLGRF
jgi:ferrous iron transport protein B